jgi:hypothetical protein
MTGRQSLLADIEAKRRKRTADRIEVLSAGISFSPTENIGYNPYDNPGPAKPLDVDTDAAIRRKTLKSTPR